jgi:hypothetical protein
MRVSPHFILLRPRSSGFRYNSSDSWHVNTAPLAETLRVHLPDPEIGDDSNVMSRLRMYWFPYASPDDPVKLATTVNSLANDSGIMKQF